MPVSPPLRLASQSPRRAAYLRGAQLPFETLPAPIDERPRPGEDPLRYVQRMAREKAEAAGAGQGAAVLAADTIVHLDGQILGKPADADEAHDMLRRLAGRAHTVSSAFALWGPQGWTEELAHSAVHFLPYDEPLYRAYAHSGEPLDKAGAYGVQGEGGRLIHDVAGDLSTVIGLPIDLLLSALEHQDLLPAEPPMRRALRGIRARISACADSVGRSLDDITLLGVSKKQPPEAINEALSYKLFDLGENYIQDLEARAQHLGDSAPDLRWHFIGQLQRNKARKLAAVPQLHRVHGLDSLRAARALSAALEDRAAPLSALMQIHLGSEETKGGVPPAEAADRLDELCALPGLHIEGLMAIPPEGNYAETRQHFQRLRALRDQLSRPDRPLPILSMGMSGDYEIAIAEGATCVRVGSALFGARPRP